MIIRAPEDVAVEINRLVTIPCVSDGVPVPTVTFFKDGSVVEIDNRVTLAGQFLVITRTEAGDNGMYSCRAENSAGNVTSGEARLIVFRKHFSHTNHVSIH